MRLRLFLMLASLTAAVSIPARAQRTAPGSALTPELDSATTAGLLRDLEAAGARGLPTEPLLAKVREGRLKRASGPRIRAAVSALTVRLDSARAALGSYATAEELIAGADAISAGAGPDALRAVRAAAPQRPLGASLGALAQLVASGVSSRRAITMVVDLIRKNATPAAVVAFGNAVEHDASSGRPGDESAIVRLRAVEASVSIFADAIATSLSNPPGPDAISSSTAPPGPPRTPRRRP